MMTMIMKKKVIMKKVIMKKKVMMRMVMKKLKMIMITNFQKFLHLERNEQILLQFFQKRRKRERKNQPLNPPLPLKYS